MLSIRENCKLSKNTEIQEKSGLESRTRLIRWMQKHKIPLDASVLDIGTGNGVFLVELVGTINIHVLEPNLKMKLGKKTLAIRDALI